jgi:glycosyltransferase involved in cell wall biosynthesis
MDNTKLNILHILYAVGRNSFGLGPVALNLAKEQMKLSAAARVWCLDDDEDCQWASLTSGLPGSNIRRFNTTHPRKMLLSLEMERAAKSENRNISIVHHHALWTGLARVTNLLRDEYKIPTVVTPHGSLEKWALKKSWWKKRITLFLYEYSNLKKASCLHACSEQEIAGFRDFGLNNPIAVIPNGIATDWLDSSGNGDAFRNFHKIPHDTRIMLFLSRVTPVKGLPLLIQALSTIHNKLNDWLLVIAGSDELNHKAEVLELISKYRLDNHVRFTGLLLGREKRDAFAAADLFVLPTKREASPVVVLEALGAGIPVLTTKGSPWEPLISQNCGWWVDVSSEAIAEAVKDAMAYTPDKLRSMGHRGKELVASKYTWTKSAQMTLELYAWLLGNNERPDFVVLD